MKFIKVIKQLILRNKVLFALLVMGITYMILMRIDSYDRKVIPGKYYYATDKLESTIKVNEDNTYSQIIISKDNSEVYLYKGNLSVNYKLVTFKATSDTLQDGIGIMLDSYGEPLEEPEAAYAANAIVQENLLVFNIDYHYTFELQN